MTLRILSTLAVAAPLRRLLPAGRADVVYEPTARLLTRIEDGERADIAILTDSGIDGLLAQGVLRAGSRRDLVRSHIGVAVRAGAPKPDISTVAALRRTLLDAPTIAYSRAGASGIFFADLIERLGIAQAVNAKATVIPQGFTAELAARGEVALAVQQVSELLAVDGIDLVGRLPEEANVAAIFSAGIFRDAAAEADAMLDWLGHALDAATLSAAGLEPA